MFVFDHPEFDQHSAVHAHYDPATGLKAIIAIHRAWAKPSVGGCRLRNYASDDEALTDVLRLSRAMTAKSVMSGLDYGGAKCVILADPQRIDRKALFRAMGDVVESLNGRIKTGVDVGLTLEDVRVMRTRTDHVLGLSSLAPDVVTAHGVHTAIKAAVARALGRSDLEGLRVAIQGLGKVGLKLAELLRAEGAAVIGSDVDARAVAEARERLGVEIVAPDAILAQEVDVLSPCALGAVLNDATIPAIRARVVAGSANDQLAEARHGAELARRGILYAPDYVANCGGLLAVARDIEGRPESWVWDKVAEIARTLDEVFDLAAREGLPTHAAADRIAAERIAALSGAGARLAA